MSELSLMSVKRSSDIGAVSLYLQELRPLLCMAPLDMKVYVALLAYSRNGKVVSGLHEMPRRLRGWLRVIDGNGRVRNSLGVPAVRASQDEDEIVELRKSLKRLEGCGLLHHEKQLREDGRFASVFSFPWREGLE